jgi:hypothetical protein
MATDDKRPSLRDMDAAEIRNRQRSSPEAHADGVNEGPEANATMRRIWSDPGGEAYNLRNAMVGAGGKADDHGELTAAETPETTRHLSDASLPPGEGPHAAPDTLGQPDRGTAGQAGRDDAPDRGA